MSKFEFLAVFVSIIFGLSLTHVLSGAMRSIYQRTFEQTHLVLTSFILIVLVLNWWMTFAWSGQEIWTLDLFLVMITWAISHYVVAITLYPPDTPDGPGFDDRRAWFFGAFVAVTIFDILQTAARGDLFSPWYYLPFVLHLTVLSAIAIFFKSPLFHKILAWYFLIIMVSWSLVVRRFLE
jgi:hypothetical protein